MGLGPPALFLLIMTFGQIDFEACFNGMDISVSQALARLFDSVMLSLLAMSTLPFVLLALVWLFCRNRARVLWVWGILLAVSVFLMLGPDMQHSCDLSGYEGDAVLLMPIFATLPALLIALWRNPSRRIA